MDHIEFGTMVTFDQGYGEIGVVLAHDDRHNLITIMAKGEEPHEMPLIARNSTGIAMIHDNWKSESWALAMARAELVQSSERWDQRPELPYRIAHPHDGRCKYQVGDFVTTALIGKWRIYPRRQKGTPDGLTWAEICQGVIDYLAPKVRA